MSAKPIRFYPHNVPWRKIRRRHGFHPLSMFTSGMAAIPFAFLLAWMSRDAGWGWLAVLTGVIWVLSKLFHLGIWAVSLLARSRTGRRLGSAQGLFAFDIYMFGNGLSLIALLLGRIDLALSIEFGWNALISLMPINGKTIGAQNLLSALLYGALLAAFALHAVGLAAI